MNEAMVFIQRVQKAAQVIRADQEARRALHQRDKLAMELASDIYGMEFPAVRPWTDPETGDKYVLYLSAKLVIVERGGQDASASSDDEGNGGERPQGWDSV